MFIHVMVDNDITEIVAINEVEQSSIIDALSNTPEGVVSYVVNTFGICGCLEEFRQYDYDEMIEQLFMSEEEGCLVAKYDNDVLE